MSQYINDLKNNFSINRNTYFIYQLLTYAFWLNSTPCKIRKASSCCWSMEKMSFLTLELNNISHLLKSKKPIILLWRNIYTCMYIYLGKRKKKKGQNTPSHNKCLIKYDTLSVERHSFYSILIWHKHFLHFH